MQHAQARNVIEHIFVVLKKWFTVLNKPLQYSINDQAKVIHALCVTHNFIWIYDPDDMPEIEEEFNLEAGSAQNNLVGSVPRAEWNHAAQKRDEIAVAMWASYQSVIQHRW